MGTFLEAWKRKSKSRKSALALATSIFIQTFLCGVSTCRAEESGKVYLVDVNTDYSNIRFYDDIDTETSGFIDIKKGDDLLALVNEEDTEPGKMYRVMLVKGNGEMLPGYIDGQVLCDDAIDKVEVLRDVLDECKIVGAKDGLWQRQDRNLDISTKNARLLEGGTFVACANEEISSKDNSLMWDETISVDGKKITHGYVANEFLINSDYDKIEGKRFTVKLNGAPKLKLREGPNTNSKIISELEENTEVILIPNVCSVSDEDYDWFYVVVKTKDGIKIGYTVATMYGDTRTVNYLVEKEDIKSKKIIQENHKLIARIVDTPNNGHLHLRSIPGIDGDIIADLEKGSTVFQIQNGKGVIRKDDLEWVEVELHDGKRGYVADKFLKDNDEKVIDSKSETCIVDLGTGGRVEGYFGIDVQNTISSVDFEKLISGEHNYDVHYAVSRPEIKQIDIPRFVMFKLGATGYGTPLSKSAVLAGTNSNADKRLKNLTKICIEHKIPYGFYYYSQAINDKDIAMEVQYIKNVLDEIGQSDYDTLPLVMDFESIAGINGPKPTRIRRSATATSKEDYTKIANKLMNTVREQTGREVILYTDKNTLNDCLDYSSLDEQNQRNLWIVNPSSSHGNDLVSFHPDVVENTGIRQIALDGVVQGVPLDVNLINKDYFESFHSKSKNLIKSINR